MKEDLHETRIDKWLWAVRIFKTRSIATEVCKKGRVSINGIAVKPSRNVHVNEIVEVRRPPVTYRFAVKAIAEKRMSAALTPNFVQDITPQDELKILELSKLSAAGGRDKGLGRPTKKDRRSLDNFINDTEVSPFNDFDWGDE